MIYDKVTHRKEEGSDEGGTDKSTRSEENLPSEVRVLLGVGLQFAERFHEGMLTSVRAFTAQLSLCIHHYSWREVLYLHSNDVGNPGDAVAKCGDISEFAIVELDGVYDVWRGR